MALRKTITTKRLFYGFKTTSPSTTLEHTPICSPPFQAIVHPNASRTNCHREDLTSPDSGHKCFLPRFLHRRAVYHSVPFSLPKFMSLPVGDKLQEKLKGINVTGNRIVLEALSPPEPDQATADSLYGLSGNDARKILRASQVEKLKTKLREIPKTSILYSEFIETCAEGCESKERGAEFAKILDESGNVIVLGNVVFLRPEQVAKTMETLISQSIANPNDPRRKVLAEMVKQKAMIDDKAKALVRGELYCGLGLWILQTLGFMRLTFWELSWDVMEPICFFVTSFHLGLAHLFFLKTSTEPTFQGYFYRRFKAKQKRLMKTYNFDIQRYHDLCKACYPNYHAGEQSHLFSPSNHAQGGALHY